MATTVLCNQCGTRNRAALGHCRRCNATLGDGDATAHTTARGTPTSEVVADRWVVAGDLDDMSAHWLAGRDTVSADPVLICRLRLRDGLGLNSMQLFDLANRRQDVAGEGLLELCGVSEYGDDIVLVFPKRPGRPLSTAIGGGALPLTVALGIIDRVVDGIDSLHDAGLVCHRLGADSIWLDTGGDGAMPHAAIGGAVRAATSELRADDYRICAHLLAAMLLDQQCHVDAPAGQTIGRALCDVEDRHGQQVATSMQRLFDILVRSHNANVRRGGDIGSVIDGIVESTTSTMVGIPGGGFQRGSRPGDPGHRPEQAPVRTVDVAPFFIDRTPVTAAQFQRFLEATGHRRPPGWSTFNDPQQAPHRPVVYVNWHEARAYARWCGKQLPTEAQWEKAARGPDRRPYPWGDAPPDSRRAWYGERSEPRPVATLPDGTSPYGVLGMAGNVFEWVADWFDPDYYQRAPNTAPQGPPTGSRRVLRGGSYAHPAFALHCATRGRYRPDARRANHSFRCVWSPDR